MWYPRDFIAMAAIILAGIGIVSLFWYLNKQNAPIRTTVVHLMAVTLFVPGVFALALMEKIDSSTVSTLLGGFAGYLFAQVPLKAEWREGENGSRKTPRD